MRYKILLILLCIIFLIVGLVYMQRQSRTKVLYEKQQKLYMQDANRRKNLQDCLRKEDISISHSIKNDCVQNGIPTSCTPSPEVMDEIMQRVKENKEICRLKYGS